MSILIKGMEMPKNCLECVFYRRTDPVYDYCCISSATPKGYVPNDCPLVPVPPHGRLIDADDLRKKYFCGENVQHDSLHVSVGNILHFIDDAPTIIPADNDSN